MDQAWTGVEYNTDGYSAYKFSEQDQTSEQSEFKNEFNFGSLDPGQTLTLTFTKTILDSEMDSGGYSNSVTVTADNGISEVSDDPTTTQEDDPTVVNFDIVKDIEVIKTADVVDSTDSDGNTNTYNDLDDIINYTITVKNTGTVPLLMLL